MPEGRTGAGRAAREDGDPLSSPSAALSAPQPTPTPSVRTVAGVAQLVGGLWSGEGWFARGDGFEVWSTLLGRTSPFGRRDDGRLAVRSPLDGVDAVVPERGLVAVATVLFLGATALGGVLTRSDPARQPTAGQVPLVAVMVGFTVGGLSLLLSS